MLRINNQQPSFQKVNIKILKIFNTMKIKRLNENGFPPGFDPSMFYKTPEKLYPLIPSFYNTEPNRYLVSTWGRILDTTTGNFVPRELTRDRNIYIQAYLKDVNNNPIFVQMHQIIARMFVFPRPVGTNYEIVPNHKDGIKWHNEPYNLEWTTQSQNSKHANENNFISRPFGEDNGYSELTDDQYREICRLTQEGYWPNQINKIMNLEIDITNIAQKIRRGTSETLIAQEFDFSNIPRNDYRKFSEEQVRYICQTLQNHPEISYNEMIIQMGFPTNSMTHAEIKKLRDTISTIKRRKSYIEIGKEYNF